MDEFILEEQPKVDTSEERGRLARLIEAIANLVVTKEWQTLQELHFKPEADRIERLLLIEAKKSQVNEREIYKLQGELIWASRYSDLPEWARVLTHQLNKLKQHG
jgi:hypothetical protein